MSTQRHSVAPHPIFVPGQSEINIGIGHKAPATSFAELMARRDGGKEKWGGITSLAELKANLGAYCVPLSLLDGDVPLYDELLAEPRRLTAKQIHDWFEVLR